MFSNLRNWAGAVIDQFPSHDVLVGDHTTRLLDTGGPGSPVVLIHALATDHQMWRDVVAHLTPRHRVIALRCAWPRRCRWCHQTLFGSHIRGRREAFARSSASRAGAHLRHIDGGCDLLRRASRQSRPISVTLVRSDSESALPLTPERLRYRGEPMLRARTRRCFSLWVPCGFCYNLAHIQPPRGSHVQTRSPNNRYCRGNLRTSSSSIF
jgi:hypothetical protein